MKNKTFLILICIAALVALVGLFTLMITYFESGWIFLSSGLSIVNFLGFIMLLKNSSLTQTIYFRYVSIFIAIIIFGSMFKIMHWPGSAIILTIGLIGVPIIYLIRFINKPIKNQIDIIKLAWVVIAYITALGVIMHWLPRYFTYLPNLIMLTTVIQFASLCMKHKELLEK